MEKPLFIAIGVHNAKGMQVLEGVLKGIDDLTSWARNSGYDTIAIDDRAEKVSIDRIRNCLTPNERGEPSPAMLLDRPRIVVYFCGHGIHAPADQYWILSAGANQPGERISAVGFREVLATYGPKQISFISDACRSPMVVIGQGSAVVDAYEAEVKSPQKDIFYSSADGTASFAMPVKDGKPAYCIFSEALLKALSVPDPRGDNLDSLYLELGRRVVTSQSLANYLETHVPEIALLEAGKIQTPLCETGFRPQKNDYVEFAEGISKSLSLIEISPSLPEINQRDFINYKMALSQQELQLNRINRSRSKWRAPFVEAVQDYIQSSGSWSRNSQFGPCLVVSNRLPELVGQDPHIMPEIWQRWGWDNERMGYWFWEANGFLNTANSNVVIVNVEDLYSPVILFRDLWCAMTFKEVLAQNDNAIGGVDLLAWGGKYSHRPSRAEQLSRGELHSTEALKGLSEGTLNSDDIRLFTRTMRLMKHVDPMLGIVAAYLYNRIGDIDNIRRMCYYYGYYNQDVPFDIAMLAGVTLEYNKEQRYFAINVPEVREVPAAERAENAPEFTWENTPSVNVNVAGVTPVLRVGWQHIRNSKHRIHRQCLELVDHLTEAPIATFSGKEVGKALIQAFRGF
uniref:Peptidase C14 caspase domain-containing protein n=1 Tax=Cyanothece sp. (strain PCC 7425 / ATCC 29141) TaxID=395961 RepID=B8HUT5_CYAP4